MRSIINKKLNRAAGLCCLIALPLVLSSCGRSVNQSYESMQNNDAFKPYKSSSVVSRTESTFASSLCLPQDQSLQGVKLSNKEGGEAGGLLDITDRTTIFGSGMMERVYPASTTKIMTALVALKYGDLSQDIVISKKAANPGEDAQRLVLEQGDSMTLDQALHYLMVFSANDVAIAIAENIGGSYDEFVEMMNKEAQAIGATQSHFTNPHGLHDENHYTTPYDLYLILNAAMKYDEFREIVKLKDYNTTFKGADGDDKSIAVSATDAYLTGEVQPPEGITVLGGKTGTTEPAGHCLIIMSQNEEGDEFVSVVMKADTVEDLYSDMNGLLGEIPN